jgi:hypothetical protein
MGNRLRRGKIMAIYRISRNIEASFIDFLHTSLEESPYSWANINIVKTFAQVYELELPTICVVAENTVYNKVEIGSNDFTRTVQIIVDIFGNSDGQRLDLKDCIVAILKDGLPYNEYTITKGKFSTSSSTPNGRIRIIKTDDTVINFSTDKNLLDPKDRYRSRLTFSVNIGRNE